MDFTEKIHLFQSTTKAKLLNTIKKKKKKTPKAGNLGVQKAWPSFFFLFFYNGATPFPIQTLKSPREMLNNNIFWPQF